MDDLELEPVWVVEEHRVVPRRVGVLLRLGLDLGAVLAQPVGTFVDEPARVRLERDVVQADAVSVEAAGCVGLRRPQPDGRAGAPEVPDRLAALTLHLREPVPAEGPEEVAVEGEAALDRGDHEVDVVDAGRAHVASPPGSACPLQLLPTPVANRAMHGSWVEPLLEEPLPQLAFGGELEEEPGERPDRD